MPPKSSFSAPQQPQNTMAVYDTTSGSWWEAANPWWKAARTKDRKTDTTGEQGFWTTDKPTACKTTTQQEKSIGTNENKGSDETNPTRGTDRIAHTRDGEPTSEAAAAFTGRFGEAITARSA